MWILAPLSWPAVIVQKPDDEALRLFVSTPRKHFEYWLETANSTEGKLSIMNSFRIFIGSFEQLPVMCIASQFFRHGSFEISGSEHDFPLNVTLDAQSDAQVFDLTQKPPMTPPIVLKILTLVLSLLCGSALFAASEVRGTAPNEPSKYLDSYEEAIRQVAALRGGKAVPALEDRLKEGYTVHGRGKKADNPEFDYDFADKVCGDFSIRLSTLARTDFDGIHLETTLWGDFFDLDKRYTLKFALKTESLRTTSEKLAVALVDSQGKTVQTDVRAKGAGSEWSDYEIPLRGFEGDDAFDMDSVQSIQISGFAMDRDSVVKIDSVRFDNGSGSVYGVTDKSLLQRLDEQNASWETRRRTAWEQLYAKPVSEKDTEMEVHMKIMAALYLKRDMAEANANLREALIENGREDKWSLFKTPYLLRMYYLFSSRAGRFPGRFEPETEKLLLEVIWNRTVDKNDIHWAAMSTWVLDGSENHDINMKACNLVSSRIFMNEPDYKDRVYPDHGFGGGYHYGKSGYFGKGIDRESRHGGGRAKLSDGKKYTAADHYKAWLRYMKKFFPERAKHGFMLEYNSPVYCKHSMNFIELMYTYGGDAKLKKTIGDFKTLYYANWAQTGAAGVSGGPKTRARNIHYVDSHAGMISPLVGGISGMTGNFTFWSSFNDYKLPPAVLRMMLDKEGMGSYVYRSRGIGEETGEIPRPFGAERSLVVNPNSRFLKYTYVTPHFTLGTQMDHPYAIHSHLSVADRFQGLRITSDPKVTIAPLSVPLEPDFGGKQANYSTNDLYRSAQHNNTLIFQHTINYVVQHPDWFPHYKQKTSQGVWIGNQWDEKIKRDGWVFLRERNVYAAVRVVAEDVEYERKKREENIGNQVNFYSDKDLATSRIQDKGYIWADEGRYMALVDNKSPVIVRAGDNTQYDDFESFIRETIGIRIELYKTVVPSFNELVVNLKSDGSGDEIVFNAGNTSPPMINGQVIDYSHPMTFDSPYLKSPYGRGIIEMGMGIDKLRLKF
jgi:hypothetical protein